MSRKVNIRGYMISELMCQDCGNIFPIPRYKCSKREKNHVKTMYCPYCKKVSNFLENYSLSVSS